MCVAVLVCSSALHKLLWVADKAKNLALTGRRHCGSSVGQVWAAGVKTPTKKECSKSAKLPSRRQLRNPPDTPNCIGTEAQVLRLRCLC